jgi:hypothetical protein
MQKEKLIKSIELLYPIDSDHLQTAAVGRQLLGEIVKKRWRELSEDLLQEYLKDCNKYEEEKSNDIM